MKTLDHHGRGVKMMGCNLVSLLQRAACEIIFSLHSQHRCSEVEECEGLHILPPIVSNASQHQIDLSENWIWDKVYFFLMAFKRIVSFPTSTPFDARSVWWSKTDMCRHIPFLCKVLEGTHFRILPVKSPNRCLSVQLCKILVGNTTSTLMLGRNRHVGVVRMSEVHAESLSTPTIYHSSWVVL